MIRISDKSQCCGCTACQAICPHGAVEMCPDGLGFKYPHVIEEKCVDCGLCEKVCPLRNDGSARKEPFSCVAMRNNDERELMNSRSGAVFPELARSVINMGGVVYGAGFDEGFRVVHKRASDMASVQGFRGSKYVQSELGDSFTEVLKDLKNGLPVLFTGTPCQCAGLKSFIPYRYADNLYLIDVVCHGVPSPYIWQDNLMCQQKKLDSPLMEVSFRDKRLFGWKAHKESYSSLKETISDDFFTYLFYQNLISRDSCHTCPYSSVLRVSDVTLADFWGCEKVIPGINADDKGLSLVLVNTEQGEAMLDKVAGDFYRQSVNLSECMQPNLRVPTPVGRGRDGFIRDYMTKGYGYIMRRYDRESVLFKIKSLYLKVLRKVKGILS